MPHQSLSTTGIPFSASGIDKNSNALKQLRQRNLQGFDNPADQLDRDVLLPALHSAHVTSVESTLMGKGFLRKPLLFA